LRAGQPWEEWNPEQQAEAIEEYNRALRRTRDGTATFQDYQDLSALQPYIDKVRRGEGAPHGMLGAWLGGLGGAAAGWLIGGPVGALVGGLGGLVGGALLGAALK
jgi:predicted lipid-binding transport protein (Tim44 family)